MNPPTPAESLLARLTSLRGAPENNTDSVPDPDRPGESICHNGPRNAAQADNEGAVEVAPATPGPAEQSGSVVADAKTSPAAGANHEPAPAADPADAAVAPGAVPAAAPADVASGSDAANPAVAPTADDIPGVPGGSGAVGSAREAVPGGAAGRGGQVVGPTGDEPPRAAGFARAAGPLGGPPRRGVGDPVRSVLHRHAALLAGAVDEWEIAAGLEARGLTDGGARRLRHRDVFGLAEELFARVPRTVSRLEEVGVPGGADTALLSWRVGALHLLPGVGCAFFGHLRVPAFGALLAVLVGLATWAALRTGPLRTARGGGAPWTYGLIAYALYGPQAVTALAGDGRFDPAAYAGTFTALALSLLPAAYCARWFAVRSRAQLGPSHGLSDFADAVRPRLAAALAAYTLVLVALLIPARTIAGPAALGLLLFTARLMSVHGRPGSGTAVLAAACAAEALTLAAAPLGLGLAGTTAQALICGAAAVALAVRACHVLTRASAHRPSGGSRT